MFYRMLVTLSFASCLITACAVEEESSTLALNIDKGRVTASGVSAGAHMAHQLHIAYSDLFSGVGIFSGGPYNCANNSLNQGLSLCMMNTGTPIDVGAIADGIRQASAAGELADPANLADDRVWLFRGTMDSKISSQVHGAAAELYANFMALERIVSVTDFEADHVFPADGRGVSCFAVEPPYVGDCGYDGAGIMLQYLYPGLVEPSGNETGNGLLETRLPGADDANLLDTAYAFIPEDCAGGEQECALHLVLHGCAQSTEDVGTGFIELSGYLPWAEANDIVLLFPQVEKSVVAPLNPYGCWDWWGYTGDDYAKRSGRQMKVLVDWIDGLSQ
jgi:poly(3-hydroxybutyrate) depolymerase